jgi:hypothetical protein
VELPSGSTADVEIVNLFMQDDGPAIVFPQTGFSCSACSIDGNTANFAEYLLAHNIDTRLPLVADHAGAMVNVSVQAVNAARGTVQLYAPVIAGETYRLAKPIVDYGSTFVSRASAYKEPNQTFACNCILNFLYAGLEGQTSGGFVGPVTFGEIAYILLNQTLVVLRYQAATAATKVARRRAVLAV